MNDPFFPQSLQKTHKSVNVYRQIMEYVQNHVIVIPALSHIWYWSGPRAEFLGDKQVLQAKSLTDLELNCVNALSEGDIIMS